MNLTAVVIVASYSASVLSRIMTDSGKLPFNSFEEFLEVGTYTLAVGRHGGHFTHFQVSLLNVISHVLCSTLLANFPLEDEGGL
jgi:hypothetical protein